MKVPTVISIDSIVNRRAKIAIVGLGYVGLPLAVAHDAFAGIIPEQLKALCGNGNGTGVVMDLKGLLNKDEVETVGLLYWGL